MNVRKIDDIEYSTRYVRSFEKLSAPLQQKIRAREKMFLEDTFNPRLKTHKLHGKFQGYWSYSIDYTYRVIFRFIDNKTVLYHDVGDHSLYD